MSNLSSWPGRGPGPGGWVPQQAPQATSAASRAALSRLCRLALHVYVPGRRAAESDAHSEADSHRGTLAALKTQAAGSVSDRPHRARRLPAPGPGRVTGPTSRRNCVQRPHERGPQSSTTTVTSAPTAPCARSRNLELVAWRIVHRQDTRTGTEVATYSAWL